MRCPRVVLDTNCLVSALLFRNGRLPGLRISWQSGQFIPPACQESVAELIRVLSYPKFRLAQDDIESLLADVLPWMEISAIKGRQPAIAQLRDPEDAVFIHLARQAKADMLVSGDTHLLSLKDMIEGVSIMPPAEFSDWLQEHHWRRKLRTLKSRI